MATPKLPAPSVPARYLTNEQKKSLFEDVMRIQLEPLPGEAERDWPMGVFQLARGSLAHRLGINFRTMSRGRAITGVATCDSPSSSERRV